MKTSGFRFVKDSVLTVAEEYSKDLKLSYDDDNPTNHPVIQRDFPETDGTVHKEVRLPAIIPYFMGRSHELT